MTIDEKDKHNHSCSLTDTNQSERTKIAIEEPILSHDVVIAFIDRLIEENHILSAESINKKLIERFVNESITLPSLKDIQNLIRRKKRGFFLINIIKFLKVF